ncbi:MAG TPA: transcription antitermination factor NusB [Myxococcaceae bacterium]|nr:transcription antitermination factor NusB [Myxococcaceae bacterium]
MGARRIGRERALQALYQLEMVALEPTAALEVAWASEPEEGTKDTRTEARAFADDLVRGVREHQEEIDRLLEEHSHNWRLDRMARVDRNVLRLAVYELRYREDIPKKVTLNEAVELGKRFGTEESSAFINGILDRIAQMVEKP